MTGRKTGAGGPSFALQGLGTTALDASRPPNLSALSQNAVGAGKNGNRRDDPNFVEERLGTKPRGIRDRFGKPARLTGEATAHAETLPRRRRQYPPFVITVRAPGENCQK